jgi:hypothetical protein
MMLIFSSCGNEDYANLAQDPLLGLAENKDLLTDSPSTQCNKPFTATLSQTKNKGTSAAIKFAVASNEAFNDVTLSENTTNEQRCAEFKNYLTGASIRTGSKLVAGKLALEVSFLTSENEEKQMADGKAINSKPSITSLEYVDGSLNGSLHSIDIQCPDTFSITCEAEEIDGKKECMSYSVSYSNQSCKFRILSLPIQFSDHKITQVDVSGGLDFAAPNGLHINFSKISWNGLY